MDLLIWFRAQWDRIVGFGCVGVGALLLLLGWVGASGASRSADEISYLISGGLAGLFLLGIGATLLISADMHDEWRKLDRIESAILAGVGAGTGTGTGTADAPRVSGAAAPVPGPEAAGRTSTVALVRWPDATAAGLAALAAGLVAAGWVRASSATGREAEVGGAYLATAGLVFLAVAAAGFLVSCRTRCRDRKVNLLAPYAAPLARRPAETRERPASGEVLVADGIPLHHRPGCPILAGQQVTVIASSGVTPGTTACGICGG